MLKSLEEYERERSAVVEAVVPNRTGVSCPECGAELISDGNSLISTLPPMKRVTCPACEFSKVVLA
jgi:transposase